EEEERERDCELQGEGEKGLHATGSEGGFTCESAQESNAEDPRFGGSKDERRRGPRTRSAVAGAADRAWRGSGSGVVVQRELVRMRAQPDRVDLVRLLVVDPGLDHVLGEDVALAQAV